MMRLAILITVVAVVAAQYPYSQQQGRPQPQQTLSLPNFNSQSQVPNFFTNPQQAFGNFNPQPQQNPISGYNPYIQQSAAPAPLPQQQYAPQPQPQPQYAAPQPQPQYAAPQPQPQYAAPQTQFSPASFQQQGQAPRYSPAPVHYVNIGNMLQGDYKFGFDAGNGGPFREESRLPDGSVTGAYGYTDTDGKQRIVKYSAGIEGFKILGEDGPAAAQRGAAPSAPQSQPQPHITYAPS